MCIRDSPPPPPPLRLVLIRTGRTDNTWSSRPVDRDPPPGAVRGSADVCGSQSESALDELAGGTARLQRDGDCERVARPGLSHSSSSLSSTSSSAAASAAAAAAAGGGGGGGQAGCLLARRPTSTYHHRHHHRHQPYCQRSHRPTPPQRPARTRATSLSGKHYLSTNINYKAVTIRPARLNCAVDRKLDDYCDKLVVERRSSEVLSTQLTDDCPVYRALSVQLSRAKSITRFDDRRTEAKFSKSGV